MSRLARLSAAKGGKTRAIVKLLGRGAIVLAASALDLSLWVFWAALRALRLLLILQSRCRAVSRCARLAAAQAAPRSRRELAASRAPSPA